MMYKFLISGKILDIYEREAQLRPLKPRNPENDALFTEIILSISTVLLCALTLVFLSNVVSYAIPATSILLTQLVFPLTASFLAVLVFFCKNAIHSLLSLMGVFLSTAAIYITNGAEYFALVFLLIGQGAVAILFLYAVILLPLREQKSATSVRPHRLGKTIFELFFAISAASELEDAFQKQFGVNNNMLQSLEYSTSNAVRQYVQGPANDILSFVGLYENNSVLFILITGILLVAMLGAIVLATASSEDDNTHEK